MNKISLREKATLLNDNGGISFMEGRKKAEEIPTRRILTIKDFGFIKGEDGEYVVLDFNEEQELFYFGGGVVTEKMKNFDNPEAREEIFKSGLPVLFEKKTSKKSKRGYMTCTFFPEDDLPEDEKTDSEIAY